MGDALKALPFTLDLYECKPYRARLSAVSCAAQFKMAARADTKSPFIHRECLGCTVGEANAETNPDADGKPSWPRPPRNAAAKRAARKRGEKPKCTCAHCGKKFVGHRSDQRFCPGGKCNAEFQRARNQPPVTRGTVAMGQSPSVLLLVQVINEMAEAQNHSTGWKGRVAADLGIDPSVLGKLLSGQRGVHAKTIDSIASRSDRFKALLQGGDPRPIGTPSPRSNGSTTVVEPADLAHAHSVLMDAVERYPEAFSGLSAAALPLLAVRVAAAIVRARNGAT